MTAQLRRELILIGTLLIAVLILIFAKNAPKREITDRSDYHNLIKKYADRHGFDSRLITAMIRKESNFNPRAISRVGAKGLMQLMPLTARELGVRNAFDPDQNISGGVRYLKKMYGYFPKSNKNDRLKLALASYNCSLGRVLDAKTIAKFEKKNPDRWSSIRFALPKLSRSHRKFHKKVFRRDHPKYGYFSGSSETIDYVETIMRDYQN